MYRIIFLLIFLYVTPVMNTFSQVDTSYAFALVQQGDSLRKMMELDKAENQYLKARALFKRSNYWPGYLLSNSHIAKIWLQKGQFIEAKSLTQQSLKEGLNKRGKHQLEIARLYNLMAAIESNQTSNYAEALKFHQKALEILDQLDGQESLAMKGRTLGFIGMIHKIRGDYDKALRYFNQEIQLLKSSKGEKTLFLSFSYKNIAKIYSNKGQYQRAFELFDKAIEIQESQLGSNHDLTLDTYQDQAILFQKTGNLIKSLEILEKVKAGFQDTPGIINVGYARAVQETSRIYQEKGDLKKAQDALSEALKLFEQILDPNDIELANIRYDLSKLLLETGAYRRAIFQAKLANKFFLQNLGDQHLAVAKTYNLLGKIYQAQFLYEEAKTYFQAAIIIQESIFQGEHPELSKAYFDLGKLYEIQGDQDSAFFQFNCALKALPVEKNRTTSENEFTFNHPVAMDIYHAIGQHHKEAAIEGATIDQLKKALDQYYSALDVFSYLINNYQQTSTILWFERSFSLFEEALSLAYHLYELTADPIFAEKALELSERSRSVLLKQHLRLDNSLQFSGIPDSLLEKERRLRQELSYYRNQLWELYQHPEADSSLMITQNIWKEKLFSLQKAHQALKRKLKRSYPSYFQIALEEQKPDFKDLKENATKSQSAILQTFWGDSTLHIISLSEEGYQWKKLSNILDLQPLASTFIRILKDQNRIQEKGPQVYRQFTELSYTLYQQIFKEVIDSLPKSVKTIQINPDGILNYIPAEILITQKVEKELPYSKLPFLLKSYSIFYDHGLSALSNRRRRLFYPYKYLGFAPSYETPLAAEVTISGDRTIPGNLNYNSEEVEYGARIFDGQGYFGNNASKELFTSIAPDAKILHLAMHAFLNDQWPYQSKLIFTNQTADQNNFALHTHELFNMELSAQLALLSACNTDMGKLVRGEGVISLARGFSYAGVPSVTMSLWQINDASNKKIISDYFYNLKDNLPKSEALRKAKLNYLKKADKAFSHPFYWAALVQFGEDTPIYLNYTSPFPMWIWYAAGGALLILLGLGIYIIYGATKRKPTP